jgi:hypothetical protein
LRLLELAISSLLRHKAIGSLAEALLAIYTHLRHCPLLLEVPLLTEILKALARRSDLTVHLCLLTGISS